MTDMMVSVVMLIACITFAVGFWLGVLVGKGVPRD